MDKIEKVARALAAADGRDPDKPFGNWQFRRIVGKTIPIFRYDPKAANWTYYVPLAKLFVAAAEVLRDA